MEVDEEIVSPIASHRYMIDHVFLPRKLPEKPLDLHNTESNLLRSITTIIESLENESIPSAVQRLFTNMRQLHCIDALHPKAISEQIKNMKTGEMLGIYVREQNCGLFIHRANDDDEVTLSTFCASLPNEMVYGTNINGDIQIDYPTRAIKVKLSKMLKSEDFAKQINFLNSKQMDRAMPKSQKAGHGFVEVRNVPHPMYVSQWLVATASSRSSQVNKQFPVISKKMRDEVSMGQEYLPFRRSGFYTAMKVFLQLGLTIEMGEVRGKFVYKLVMLKLMSGFCNKHPIDSDIVMQMLAKIARRIDKMRFFSECADELGNELITLKDMIIDDAVETIRVARKKLNANFDAMQTNVSLREMQRLPFEQGVNHQIPKLLAYIEKRNEKSASESVDNSPNAKHIPRHAWENMAFPDVNQLSQVSGEIDVLQLLADFEHWTLVALEENYRKYTASSIRTLATMYMTKAQSFYQNDCFGYSKMVLVMLKIIQVMDMAAIKEHALLRSHSSGINPNVIDNLLLPSQFYLRIATKLQIYFRSRNASAQYPGLLEENNISRSSFSVRFAESNSEMQRVRREILAMAERRVQEKRVEYDKACKTVREMRSRHTRLNHEWYFCHHQWCNKCSLQKEIHNYRVGIYERPLKPEDYNQYGVVFELLMPLEIECLRDVLHFFVTKHYKQSLSRLGINGQWTNYKQISQYSRSHPENVHLGSTSKLVETSHYGEPKHPDCPFDDFILDNGYNCTFFGGNYSSLPDDTSQQSVKESVTFSVQTSSVYSGLQWTLSSTSHTQNEVLTKQCDCPETLSLNEFVNFGSLRADGHRLQLRNLYRVLETGGLSFETQSVLALVMQSLWEAGPLGATDQWYREPLEDFADGIFAMSMIDLLEKFVEQQANNWKHPLKLIVVAAIAAKAFEINGNEANADRIAKLLIRIREIVVDWISLIVETIGKCADEKSRACVYANLVEVAICGVFTYNVSRHHPFFDKIFDTTHSSTKKTRSSLFSWLHFIVTIDCNIVQRNNQHPGIKRQLIRLVYNIGLNAEAKIKSLIENNPDEVHKFVQFRWSESRTQIIDRVQHCVHSSQIISMAVRSENNCNYVQIDLVSGEFLVNDLPVARLPATITNNHLFLSVFGDTIFEVQPSNRSFSTVYQYGGFNYIFRMDNESLIISEQRPNDVRELIPSQTLIGEIPYLLVENYSHWWNRGTNIIEFRPKTFGSQDFSTSNGVQYKLKLNTRQLKHSKTNKLLLDIRSQSYQRIVEFVSRLEQKKFIHVLMDAPAKAKVHLMRMNLKFIIDCTNATLHDTIDVESNEYCGMRISLNQTFGTLIGCQRGLLLEAIPTVNKSNSKLFIVPHGKININRADPHVSVDIDLNELTLRKPPFFRFRVDIECQQINADNFPGWFYLAYLHAVTSHHLPDPFTGMTGTERALHILQSARVWSSSPYDAESIVTLRSIAALTPIRTFYPPHLRVIQKVQWPAAISSTAAQESYLLIVQKLMSDSQRLSQLHFKNDKTVIKTHTYLSLNERDHARHLPYNPNFNVSKKFIHPRNTVTRFQAHEDDSNVLGVRQLATYYDEKKIVIPGTVTEFIFGLLTSKKTLQGVSDEKITNVIEFASSNNLQNLWIRLYDCARSGKLTREMFQILLSYLHFEGNSIQHLNILHAIAENAQEFAQINPPNVYEYCETGRYKFERETVKTIIKSTEIGLKTFLSEKNENWGHTEFKRRKVDFESEYEEGVSSVTNQLTNHVERLWPCDEVGPTSILSAKVNITESIRLINPCLRMWNDNRKLVLFIDKLEAKLKQLNGTIEFSPDEWPIYNVDEKPFPKYVINFEEKLSRNFKLPPQNAEGDIEQARQIFVEKGVENVRTLYEWWDRFKDISIPPNEMHLVHAELYPNLIPSLVLPKLLQPLCDQQKVMIGAIAVMMTREQRTQRISRFEHQPQMELVLRRERENQPHENWMPHERPEWLLFEIEMDLSIRRIQVEIAERMIEPPGDQHSVMQLNMGEGKTAVIVPILAAVLADGKQLCTVTVLKSLFQTNLRSLRQCLGGMLNRRIYTFPCRRDMQIEAVAGNLLSIYEECMRECGVVMTLPEYRLSFQLKIYETARKEDTANAAHFLNVHKWLNQNSRHVLDESDAILDAKYQLIYTVGAQLPPDGNELRWKIVQAVLKRVPFHMHRLFCANGEQAIEFNENYQIDGINYGQGEVANRPEVFRPCRLLDESIYSELSDALIKDFLDGELNILFPEMSLAVSEQIRDVLRNPDIGHEQHAALIDQFEESPKKTILILSGLLKFQVLKLSLLKRWRVNYGVNSIGSRKMAVPFRAKDVAAEMTEFGHPDVAICLTHFSYYYSGLTDQQLYDTFKVLALTENPDEIYYEWIRSIPQHLVSNSIASYKGINLSDPGQRDTQLFPLLRFNMYVIDYWLSNEVFPREAKIFEGKLMCSAWDLCTEHLQHICTGFSGTNDTTLVLPMPIVQNDLPELEATNENVRRILLREENNHYLPLPSNVSGMDILKQLLADGITVLLDAGALMLELNNEQVAREWLNLASIEDYDAAIFFNEQDIIMTIDRNNFITEFEYSVYRERLGRCLVYMDDIHTRGTDLKFPSGIRACVTLSGRITRDKTVQACMRMRMLGQGHMVSFYASLEADIGIRKLNDIRPEDINTSHVIEYVCNNSQIFGKEGLVHWSAAGLNYTQKLAAHKFFEDGTALSELSKRCTDPENTPLIDMYGAKVVQELSVITHNHFSRIALIYNEQKPILDWIHGIRDGVVLKLKNHIPEVVRYTQLLDEEQEKELEHELEEQRQVHRPPPRPPIIPHLNPLLRTLFTYGKSHDSLAELRRTNGIRKLPLAFKNTTLFSIMEPQISAWNDNIVVTEDFLSVAMLSPNDRDDEFIRPVWWIARVVDPNNDDLLILLSTFESNQLLPTFRSSLKSILHMFSPKLSMTHSNLLNNTNLQVPANSLFGNIAASKAVQIIMFAGSMYFNDEVEEKAYIDFMGFIPRPRSAEYKKAFEEGAITSNGYVPIEHRHRFAELLETCRFTENPDAIAIEIINRRHGYLSANSHVSLLLREGKRFRWKN